MILGGTQHNNQSERMREGVGVGEAKARLGGPAGPLFVDLAQPGGELALHIGLGVGEAAGAEEAALDESRQREYLSR